MYDYSSLMALKELVMGEEQQKQIVSNPYKGSMLDPGVIGNDGEKKEIAKPNAKIQAKFGEKYISKPKEVKEVEKKKPIPSKYAIWTEEQIAQLPLVKNDPRKQPLFQSMYRQKVGTEDVFLGLSGVDPTSNNCQQIIYKIQLPDTNLKDIQMDINQKQMVIQTSKYYLAEYFQYKMDCKKAKAKFVSDKGVLELILPIVRED